MHFHSTSKITFYNFSIKFKIINLLLHIAKIEIMKIGRVIYYKSIFTFSDFSIQMHENWKDEKKFNLNNFTLKFDKNSN